MTRINLVSPLTATANLAQLYGAQNVSIDAVDYANRYAPISGPTGVAVSAYGLRTGEPMDFNLAGAGLSGLSTDFPRRRSIVANYSAVESAIGFNYYDETVGSIVVFTILPVPSIGETFIFHLTAEVSGANELDWAMFFEGGASVSGTETVAPWDAGGFDYAASLFAGANGAYLTRNLRLALRAGGALPATQASYLATDPHYRLSTDLPPGTPEPDVNGQWISTLSVGGYSPWGVPV